MRVASLKTQRARELMYAEFARRQSSMTSKVARACIHADYQDTFDSLSTVPDVWLEIDSYHCTNKHYHETINFRIVELAWRSTS
jgi:hypothetical protein